MSSFLFIFIECDNEDLIVFDTYEFVSNNKLSVSENRIERIEIYLILMLFRLSIQLVFDTSCINSTTILSMR